MAADLAATPDSGFRAQLCGDAHLSNFGIFGTPERKFVFDINDFDETFPGPWEWDHIIASRPGVVPSVAFWWKCDTPGAGVRPAVRACGVAF